jgi:two-component system, OmpR family, sensor histidine kinase CreC
MRATQVALLAVVIIVAVGFARLTYELLHDVEAENYRATEEVMVDVAQLLAAILEANAEQVGKLDSTVLEKAYPRALERRFHAVIYDKTKSKLTAHVYLTDGNGIVVYDSENKLVIGKDYSGRRDVALCLQGKYGARTTRTVANDAKTSIMHIAAPVMHDGKTIGVLSVRKPKIDQWYFVEQKQSAVQQSVLLIGSGIALFICAVMYWVMQPLRRLTRYILAVQRGERPAKPNVRSSQEVQTLATALEGMRDELEGRDYASRYVQTLTHELKSPLAAIRATSELLAEGNMEPAQQQRFLDILRIETDRSEHLIRQLLRLAEVERQKTLQTRVPVQFAQLVQQVIAELAPNAESKEVKIETELTEASLKVMGDEPLLHHAVTNLVENAIDFSPAQSSLRVQLKAEGTTVQLNVIDVGPGIPDYAQARLFERFYSLKHQVTGQKGSGLGLCFVKEIAELHNGGVSLKNHEPQGAIAELKLPMMS